MKLNSSSMGQVQFLFGIIGLCIGFFTASPLTSFIFNSPKGIDFLGSDWMVLPFVLACIFAGVSVPYGAMHRHVLDRTGKKLILIITFIGVGTFIGASVVGGFICSQVHLKYLNIPRWFAIVVFLAIPLVTMLVILLAGMLIKRRDISNSGERERVLSNDTNITQ
jgi:MFS family permease